MEKDTDNEETDDDDALPQGPIVLKDKKDTDSEALVLRSVDESVTPGPSGLSTRTHIDDTYNTFISLLSSESDGESNDENGDSTLSPSMSFILPPRPELENVISTKDLVSNHSQKMLSQNKDDIFRIKIRRKYIWEDSLNVFKRGVPVSKYLRITFLGEPAVDAGGPLREYFHLLLREIFTKGTIFQGKENARIPIHNVLELKKQTFKYIGNMLAASLLNGGPAPTFFADFVADYLVYGLEHVKVNIRDVLNDKMKEKLTKLMDAPDEESFVALLDSEEYNFRYYCGVSQPVSAIKLSHREDIVSALALQSVFSIKAELDQLMSGFHAYGFDELFQTYPEVTRQLFVYFKPLPLTADKLFDMFPAQLSPAGSNARKLEESALMHWVNYTQSVEDGNGTLEVVNSEGEPETYHITLEMIMMFGTGMTEEPPMGFQPKPSLTFHRYRLFPEGNTCDNNIRIPAKEMSYDQFAYKVTFGITNSLGYGMP